MVNRRELTTRPRSNPLDRWLTKRRLTRTEFARLCSAEGLRVRVQVVSRWALGQARPNQHSRALIARVTRGEVPPEAWFRSYSKAA